MHYKIISYVVFIDFLTIMSPGPDFFMVLKNSLTGSLKAGIYTTLGISLGATIVFSLCIFGIGILITENHLLFLLVKGFGVVYLSYLGITSIFARAKVHEPEMLLKQDPNISMAQQFKIGLICNLTNPKALMFMTALSAYVAQNGNPKVDGVPIIIASTTLTLAWFVLVSFLFGNSHIRKVFYQKQRLINIILGIILIGVAGEIALN